MYHNFLSNLEDYEQQYGNAAKQYYNYTVQNRPKSEYVSVLNPIMDVHHSLTNQVKSWKNQPWYNLICKHYSDSSSHHMIQVDSCRKFCANTVNINYGFIYSR